MLRLGKLESIGQLADLFHSLGYTRHLEQTGNNSWIVGRWRGFRVAAETSVEPEKTAFKMAKAMVAQSQRALAVAISPGREMSVSAPRIGVPGVTRPLSILVDAPTTFELHKLELLRPAEETTALAHSLRVAEVLDSEPAGDRFFTAFRVVFERMLNSRRDVPEPDSRSLVLLALIRILFLYFVQAKGWLDGRGDYLRSLFDRSLHARKHFHRDVLNELFFGSLNVPQPRRTANDLGKIPYLNGGLFEPNPVEKRWPKFYLSNEVWRDALDELFERFQFCVSESEHIDSIAPDMLGRVFERMGEPDRNSTGTFYTPEVIVTQIVEATLETALIGRGGMSRARATAFVQGKCDDQNRESLSQFLKTVRVLDPAVGSGAFLLGALEVLSRMCGGLFPASDPVETRRRIIKNNLFGVDQSPTAVKLAELRLWLALIARDASPDIASIEPLPNLNGVVRQGDTLIDPLSSLHNNAAARRDSQKVRAARDSVFSARGPDRVRKIDTLRVAERNLATRLLKNEAAKNEQHIREIEELQFGKDLFGKPRRLNSAERKRLERLVIRSGQINAELEKIKDGRIPFFSFKVHAPDVMNRGGFDVVVGNPPWVRAEKIEPQVRAVLRERFSWWRGSQLRGYAHLPDLSVAFLQRAFQLTAPGGAVGFLVPSKLLTSNYAAAARANLVRESTVTYLHRVSEKHASRFGATTYPLAIIARNDKPDPEDPVKLAFSDPIGITHKELDQEGPWLLLESKARTAIEQLKAAGIPLRELSPPSLGVKTGLNRAFVGQIRSSTDQVTTVVLDSAPVPLETRIIRPAVRGRDIGHFCLKTSKVLLWPYNSSGNVWSSLPPLAARYFEPMREELNARADYRHGPPWVLFRTKSLRMQYLVAWADISRRPTAVVIDRRTGRIPLNSCYVCGFEDRDRAHCVTAVVNSVWTQAIAHSCGDEARGGYRRVNARLAGDFPIPTSSSQTRILADLSRKAHADQRFDRSEIDDAVAQALGLSISVQKAVRSILNR